jgi:hypothetical protein
VSLWPSTASTAPPALNALSPRQSPFETDDVGENAFSLSGSSLVTLSRNELTFIWPSFGLARQQDEDQTKSSD